MVGMGSVDAGIVVRVGKHHCFDVGSSLGSVVVADCMLELEKG